MDFWHLGETNLEIKLLVKMEVNQSITDYIQTRQLAWFVLIQRMDGN